MKNLFLIFVFLLSITICSAQSGKESYKFDELPLVARNFTLRSIQSSFDSIKRVFTNDSSRFMKLDFQINHDTVINTEGMGFLFKYNVVSTEKKAYLSYTIKQTNGETLKPNSTRISFTCKDSTHIPRHTADTYEDMKKKQNEFKCSDVGIIIH